MQSVGHEGGGADPASDADAVERDEFVADETDETGGSDPAEVVDRDGVDKAADRFDRGDPADRVIMAMTNRPARSSARPYP